MRGSKPRVSGSLFGCGYLVFLVRRRRVPDFRPTALRLNSAMGFRPVRLLITFLYPMDQRSLITPVQEARHRLSMRSSEHK